VQVGGSGLILLVGLLVGAIGEAVGGSSCAGTGLPVGGRYVREAVEARLAGGAAQQASLDVGTDLWRDESCAASGLCFCR
jgi:hypothetical protein